MGSAKKALELLACSLHPVAVVLIWIDLASRRDIGGGPKLAWALFGLTPLVPFIYVLTGGDLWWGRRSAAAMRRQADTRTDLDAPETPLSGDIAACSLAVTYAERQPALIK